MRGGSVTGTHLVFRKVVEMTESCEDFAEETTDAPTGFDWVAYMPSSFGSQRISVGSSAASTSPDQISVGRQKEQRLNSLPLSVNAPSDAFEATPRALRAFTSRNSCLPFPFGRVAARQSTRRGLRLCRRSVRADASSHPPLNFPLDACYTSRYYRPCYARCNIHR
jgi:hypothetical protein